jgi:PAS domain S-box-containing protein
MELYIDKLRAIRKRKKITAEELAEKVGISRVTLGAWENAKRTPSEAKIRMLATVLDVPVNEISDLEPAVEISKINLSPISSSIASAISPDQERNLNRQKKLLSSIIGMTNELANARLLIDVIISSLPSIFYIKDSNLKYIAASEAFLNNLSLNKNYNVNGKTDFDFFPKNEATHNDEIDKNVLASGKSIQGTEGYIPGNRKSKWGIMFKIPIFDCEAKIGGILGCFIDITERQKAEQKYNHIVDMSSNLICIIGTDANFKFVNLAWEKVLGYTSAELLNRPYRSFIHPDDRAKTVVEENKLADGRLVLNFENRYLHKDGSIRHLLWTSAQISKDKLLYGIAVDVTQHRHTEESLRTHQVELEMQNETLRLIKMDVDAEREHYLSIYNILPVGVCILSTQGLIVENNVTAAAILGITQHKLTKKPFNSFILPEDQDIYYLKHKALLATRKQQGWKMRMLNGDGISFWVYVQAKLTQNGGIIIAFNNDNINPVN